MGNPYAQMITQAAAAYGADAPTLMGIAKLESGFNPGSVNNWDSNAKRGTPSQGMYQFIRPTFDAFSRQARAANPAAWAGVSGNWMDPRAQALTTAWAITHGHTGDWTTYGRASQGRVGLTGQPQDQVQSLAPPDPHIAAREGLIGDLFQNDPWFVKAITSKMDNASAAATAAAPLSAPLGAPTAGGAPGYTGGAGPLHNYKDIMRFAANHFGLNVQGVGETTGGHHAPGSYHYKGEAVDFGDATNSVAKLDAFAAWARQNPSYFKELFFNPLGWGIKNGQIIKGLTVAGHDDHLHVAV